MSTTSVSTVIAWKFKTVLTILRAKNLPIPAMVNFYYGQLVSGVKVDEIILLKAYDKCLSPEIERACPTLRKQINRISYVRDELIKLAEYRVFHISRMALDELHKKRININKYKNIREQMQKDNKVSLVTCSIKEIELLKELTNVVLIDTVPTNLANILNVVEHLPTFSGLNKYETKLNYCLHRLLPAEHRYITEYMCNKPLYISRGCITNHNFKLMELVDGCNKEVKALTLRLMLNKLLLWHILHKPISIDCTLSTALESEIIKLCHWMPANIKDVLDLDEKAKVLLLKLNYNSANNI